MNRLGPSDLTASAYRMICDFFHPAVGGVENHVYMLGVNLMKLGHKVSKSSHTLAVQNPSSLSTDFPRLDCCSNPFPSS